MTTTAKTAYSQRDRYLASSLKNLVRMPLAVAAAIVLLAIIAISIAAPVLAPYEPNTPDFAATLSGPTAEHLLGTDSLGRDVLSRIMYGGGPALINVSVAILVAMVIAIPSGIAVGLLKGWVDIAATRTADVLLSIPGIIILLMVLAMTQRSMPAAMVALGVLSAPGMLRVVRGATLGVVEEPYIAAAQVSGLNRFQIATRHIMRRIAGPVLVNGSVIGANAILADAGLNFLGLGIRPPDPSWGSLLADAAGVMDQQAWLLVPTGGIIALAILAIVLLGDGVRDATANVWSGQRSAVTRKASKAFAVKRALRALESADPAGPETTSLGLPVEGELLQVSNLEVSFPDPDGSGDWITTVDGVSFGLDAGEAIGLVGESGCGKTLTGLAVLGMLPGDARITGGSITFRGVDVTHVSSKERAKLRGKSIAFVSQEPMVALDPLFTVGSQIAEAVRVHRGFSKRTAKETAVSLLEQVRINDPAAVAKLYPHEISGGMAQRVAIAIALAGQPELLIADEPTTALDVTVQAEILALLETLQAETGMSILIISHDWGVVSTACDRAIVMYAGQIVEQGQVGEIVKSPMHPYSEGLLAANPRFAERGSVLETIPGSVPPPKDWPRGCHFAARCAFATEECALGRIPVARLEGGRSSRCIHIDELVAGREEVRS
ncbi:MAG: dipeptide/oligopeptide/nickel ABC transporter permease/ATP-binding protein [Salinibacterium sp.]|nr:dipeptide/oligopeptide/nickel ABC transporter permease/ATP-binding protein [Salinibacterium sp.]